MAVILPSQSETPADVVANLAKSNWVKVFGSLKEQRTDIWLPKFRIESQINIKEILSALGAPSLLNYSRDFEPMVGNIPAAVGQAVQKVFIEVDETGTKAAAATVIVGTLGAAMPQKAFEVHANRPFVVALVEWPTSIPVVLGVVYDPSK